MRCIRLIILIVIILLILPLRIVYSDDDEFGESGTSVSFEPGSDEFYQNLDKVENIDYATLDYWKLKEFYPEIPEDLPDNFDWYAAQENGFFTKLSDEDKKKVVSQESHIDVGELSREDTLIVLDALVENDRELEMDPELLLDSEVSRRILEEYNKKYPLYINPPEDSSKAKTTRNEAVKEAFKTVYNIDMDALEEQGVLENMKFRINNDMTLTIDQKGRDGHDVTLDPNDFEHGQLEYHENGDKPYYVVYPANGGSIGIDGSDTKLSKTAEGYNVDQAAALLAELGDNIFDAEGVTGADFSEDGYNINQADTLNDGVHSMSGVTNAVKTGAASGSTTLSVSSIDQGSYQDFLEYLDLENVTFVDDYALIDKVRYLEVSHGDDKFVIVNGENLKVTKEKITADHADSMIINNNAIATNADVIDADMVGMRFDVDSSDLVIVKGRNYEDVRLSTFILENDSIAYANITVDKENTLYFDDDISVKVNGGEQFILNVDPIELNTKDQIEMDTGNLHFETYGEKRIACLI